MAITIRKTLPASAWYTGSGDTTITLDGVTSIVSNTKKSLIKIQIPQGTNTQTANPSDKGKNYVKDLKKVEDSIKVRGWLVDSVSETAWSKAWKLRAMCASGGPIVNLTVEDVIFSTTSQEAYLEEVNFTANSLAGELINVNLGKGMARIEVELTFYLGDTR
jgi:hypothetical protein